MLYGLKQSVICFLYLLRKQNKRVNKCVRDFPVKLSAGYQFIKCWFNLFYI